MARGGSWMAVITYAAVFATAVWMSRRESSHPWLAGWVPLLTLPALYVSVPAAMVPDHMFDAVVQGWDRALFGSQPAQMLAGVAPWPILSETLHSAYLSYYLVIYLPAAWMYVRRDLEAFRETVLAFTIAMTACFVVFCLFPVEGPRYAWPPPPEVPDGPIRDVVLAILTGGSSRGTAFPSSHLAIALAVSLSSLRWQRRYGWAALVISVLLGIGAVYGGFHYATDMLAGAGIGVLAVSLGRRFGSPKRIAAPA